MWVSTPRATYGHQSEAKRRQLAAICEAVSLTPEHGSSEHDDVIHFPTVN